MNPNIGNLGSYNVIQRGFLNFVFFFSLSFASDKSILYAIWKLKVNIEIDTDRCCNMLEKKIGSIHDIHSHVDWFTSSIQIFRRNGIICRFFFCFFHFYHVVFIACASSTRNEKKIVVVVFESCTYQSRNLFLKWNKNANYHHCMRCWLLWKVLQQKTISLSLLSLLCVCERVCIFF